MPVCRNFIKFGECKDIGCLFKHDDDEIRQECGSMLGTWWTTWNECSTVCTTAILTSVSDLIQGMQYVQVGILYLWSFVPIQAQTNSR